MTAAHDVRPAGGPAEPSDPELVERINGGEISALGVLYDRYERDVRRVIARLGVAPADVDDVVQATFLDVLRAGAAYDGRASARAWLVGLAVVGVRRYRRSLSRMAARVARWALEPSRRSTTPEDDATASELADRARRALDALSAKKREVVVLVTIEGLSGEEAAAILGIPVATVWTRLHHARRELQAAVFEEEP
jgi:RNA polymerase sigma-70 factor (ECF subfamily)